MKKALSVLLALMMLSVCAVQIFAYNPDYEYEDVDEDPLEFALGELFIDGRTIDPKTVTGLIKTLGLYYYTTPEGVTGLAFSNRFYFDVVLEEGEDPYELWFGVDSEMKDRALTRMGYKSEYIDLEFASDKWKLHQSLYSRYNVYPCYYSLTSEAVEKFGYNEMSQIQRLYLHALILVGGYYETEPLVGASNDYTSTEAFRHDVNLDGAVNVKDIKVLKDFFAGKTRIVNWDACDSDADGEVTIKDLSALKHMIAGNIYD